MSLKERIVEESLKLFSVKGFSNTSITDILHAAGTSKGGFYNHFKSKEDLFHAALSRARRLWRDINLAGTENLAPPHLKVVKILENYRDSYLPDQNNFPGGCIFVNLAVELNDQEPGLAAVVNEGFTRLKGMIQRFLDASKASGHLADPCDIREVTELIFSGLLGACVMFSSDKSRENLNFTINALISHITDNIKETP